MSSGRCVPFPVTSSTNATIGWFVEVVRDVDDARKALVESDHVVHPRSRRSLICMAC